MKFNFKNIFLILTLLSFTNLYSLELSNNEATVNLSKEEKNYLKKHTFNICEQYDIYPLSGIKDNKIIGMRGAYIDEIVKRIKIKLKVIGSNSREELLKNAANNKCDIIGSLGSTQKIFTTIINTNTVMEFPYAMLGDLKSLNIAPYNDLSELTIIVRFKNIKNKILSAYPNLNIVVMNDIKKAISKVGGKTHFIALRPVTERIIQTYGFDKYKFNGVLDKVNQKSTMGVHQDHPMLLSIINKTIASIDSITSNKIKDKYSIKEFKIISYGYLWYIVILLFVLAIFLTIKYIIMLKNKQKEINEKNEKNQDLLYRLNLQSKEQLKKVLDSSLDGVQAFKSIRDEQNKIIDFEFIFSNELACKIIQKNEKELNGKRLLDIEPSHLNRIKSLNNKNLFELYCDVVESGEAKNLTFYYENKDGIKDWFVNKVVKLEDGFVVTFAIITEEIEKNNILAAQSRLASMGEMISMIAHQWRQPLSGISVLAQEIEIRRSTENLSDEELNKIIKQIQDTTNHMSKTITDFRNFFKPNKEKQLFSIKQSLEEVFEMLDFHIKKQNINIHMTDTKKDCYNLFSYEGEFKQVMINIINNSIDAIKNRANEKKDIYIQLLCNEKKIILEISDTGGGISNDIQDTLFEPYVSTKKEQNGTGLGLYMSKMILEKSFNATIEAKNTLDGACFLITFTK